MPTTIPPDLTRRAFLGGGAALLGAWMARGGDVFGPGASDGPSSFEATLRALGASLTPRQRQLMIFPADHPSRQIVNAQTVLDRPHLGTLLSAQQRRYVESLYARLLSPAGLQAFAPTIAVEGRFDGCVLAIYGEPEGRSAHVVFQGGHLMLRGGDASADNPFGGGISYGHQVGNGLWKVPGNSFASHNDAANALFATLDSAQQGATIQEASPHELVVQPQDADGRFPGIRLGSVGEAAQEAARSLVDLVLAAYPTAARQAAWKCLDANGGVEGLHFSTYASGGFYEDMSTWAEHDAATRARLGTPYWQAWRLEGPGTVLHFKGHPHVHAYLQLVGDARRTNVGSVLAASPTPIEGPRLGMLLEAALRRASGEDLAYYGKEIPGRFGAGEITTGVAYSLDPYRSRVSVATIRGAAMAPSLRAQLTARGVNILDGEPYRIATTDYMAGHTSEFGEADRVDTSATLIRDALVEQLRADGLRAIAA